MMKKLTFLDEL